MPIMRIAVLSIMFASLTMSQGAAQIPLDQIGKGFKAGLNLSNVTDYAGESSSRTGYLVGAMLNYRQNRFLAVQFELLYISKGYKINNTQVRDDEGNLLGTGNFEIILNYIEIPLMAKLTAPFSGNYIPYLAGGGFAAFPVDTRIRFLQGIPFDFDLGNANDVDAGFLAGVGMDMKSGGSWISLETRFEASFMKAVKNQRQKIRVISFLFSYWW